MVLRMSLNLKCHQLKELAVLCVGKKKDSHNFDVAGIGCMMHCDFRDVEMFF